MASKSSLEGMKLAVKVQGDRVRQLKAAKAAKAEIDVAVKELQNLKEQLQEAIAQLVPADDPEAKREQARRVKFEQLIIRKFFVVPSFEIYGGVGGLYDFGPPGCAVMQNIVDTWRQHFILAENMLEVSCPAMTPFPVLKASGHVDKFTDFMVDDTKTGECLRADKLLEERMHQAAQDPTLSAEQKTEYLQVESNAGSYSKQELKAALDKYNVCTDSGNRVCDPYEFNLMFETKIGPTGKVVGFLRPETAQGIFVNFKRLLEYNGGRMPFAAAQIGSAYRNEIAPRNGLLRVREFTLAEIEHFVNPDDKSHPKFHLIRNIAINVFSKELQTALATPVEMKVGDAVDQGIISSQTMGYFLARTFLFLTKIGIKPEKLRFRQHKTAEMAHYAKDCWDAEIFTFYGWVECVGHADRSAFDLEKHSEHSKVELKAEEVYEEKKIVEVHRITVDKGAIGQKYRKPGQLLIKHLAELSKTDALKMAEDLRAGKQRVKLCTGDEFEVEPSWFAVEIKEEAIHTLKYIPSVIEPSFGLGRILYSVLEHSFDDTMYDDDQRAILKLPSVVAPIKAGLLGLSPNPAFTPYLQRLDASCTENNLRCRIDDSGAAIGRKYARCDELGVPFSVVADFQSTKDDTVSIRFRDAPRQQIRVATDEAAGIISDLCRGRINWEQAYNTYPKFTQQEV